MFSLASYTQREPLRVGALTQSFLATHPAHAQRVVLKQLLPMFASDPDVRRQWLALAAANHSPKESSGLAIYESGEWDELAYVAVEHVKGIGLDVLLRHHKAAPLDVAVAVRIGTSILEQLVNAHARGIQVAHLDITPHSVVVRDDGSVVLTEHGLWNALSTAEAAKLRFEKGRVPYLAPELAKSLAGDSRSDVFATGAILFELLSGTRPFKGNTQLVLALAIAEGKRKTLHEVSPQVPEHVRHVVEAMLAHAPEERFQSARAALNALTSEYAASVNAREDLAAWVARARQEEGLAPPGSVAAAGVHANASHRGANGVHTSQPPRTVFGGLHSSPAASPSAAPLAIYAPHSHKAQPNAQAPSGAQRSTDVLDMSNLLGSAPRTPTERIQPSPASPPVAVQSYGAAPSYAPPPAEVPGSAYGPPLVNQPSNGVAHGGPAMPSASAPLAPPPVFSPSNDRAFMAPSSFDAGMSPPPMMLEAAPAASAPFASGSAFSSGSPGAAPPFANGSAGAQPPFASAPPGFQPSFDLGKPEPKPAAADLASRDGHTAFFKRGNAKHKQAIFVPSSLVVPPAPMPAVAMPTPAYTPPTPVAAPGVLPAPHLANQASNSPSWELAPVVAGSGAAALGAAPSSARAAFDVALAPMPRSDDMFRDPSGTLFQMKSYAKTRTAGEKRSMPLGVAVTLAAVFGFVAVTGGYLLFRLFS